MVRRLADLVTRRAGAADTGPLRPNQLRLQDVVAERQRREATQTAVRETARPATRRPLDTEPPRPRPAPPVSVPPGPAQLPWLRTALSSRAGLRQAMLLREVLDPPLSLREQDAERLRF